MNPEFLYSLNRLNVATSCAQAIVVAPNPSAAVVADRDANIPRFSGAAGIRKDIYWRTHDLRRVAVTFF